MRIVFCLLLIGLPLLMPGSGRASVLPRHHVSIDRDTIALADLFDGIPDDKAAIAVMRAPLPGQRIAIDANILTNLASAHRLDWVASNRNQRVIVTRLGQVIPRAVLSQALALALSAQGFPADSDTLLDNEKLQILVPTGSPLTVAVEQMIADQRTNRFQAIVTAPAGDHDSEPLRITGRVVQTVEIPVANRVIGAGETVRDRDLVFQRVRADIVNRTILTDFARITNRTARRTLPMGQPIRAGDLVAAYLVTKNAVVDVRVLARGMSLVMQGKSLDDGAQGDTVRILNTRSNKTIQGVVTAPNQVTVSPPGAVAN